MSLGVWWRDRLATVRQQSGPAAILLADARFLLLDIDVTGLDSNRDRARGVAVLPFHDQAFRIADITYLDLEVAERCGNSGGTGVAEKSRDLGEAMAGQLIVAYNPRFVRHMISQTAGLEALAQVGDRWIDLRALLIGVFGTDMGDMPSMKRWQQRLNIDVVSEHSAICDLASMAQLLQIAIAYCDDLRIATLEQLMESKANDEWLRG